MASASKGLSRHRQQQQAYMGYWLAQNAQEANAEGNASDMLTCGRLFGRVRCESELKRHEHGIATDVWMEYLAFSRIFKLLKLISQAS